MMMGSQPQTFPRLTAGRRSQAQGLVAAVFGCEQPVLSGLTREVDGALRAVILEVRVDGGRHQARCHSTNAHVFELVSTSLASMAMVMSGTIPALRDSRARCTATMMALPLAALRCGCSSPAWACTDDDHGYALEGLHDHGARSDVLGVLERVTGPQVAEVSEGLMKASVPSPGSQCAEPQLAAALSTPPSLVRRMEMRRKGTLLAHTKGLSSSIFLATVTPSICLRGFPLG